MLAKFKVLLSAFLTLAMAPMIMALTVRHAATARRVLLSTPTALRIERGLVPQEEVQTLYKEILEVAVPGPRDGFHGSLLGIMGDAGAKVEQMIPEERVAKFRQIIYSEQQQDEDFYQEKRESGILRIEHLKDDNRDKVRYLVNEAVENRVLEDKGTIHVYLSRPNSAALPNHTDPTDIFVLQLDGVKEWTLCQDEATFYDKNRLRNKLDKCSTYDPLEMSDLVCRREMLYPGDALYLPKRVVHSARATSDGLSAHLTFGFADNMCSQDAEEENDSGVTPREGWSFRRFLQGTCNSAQGGTSCDFMCDSNCNLSCNSGCNYGCTCSCDNILMSCDSCCNSGCNSYCDAGCNGSCDMGCDICPSTGQSPTSTGSTEDPLSTTSSSTTSGSSGGAIAGAIIGALLAVVAIALAVGVFVCKNQKQYCFKGNPVAAVQSNNVAASKKEGAGLSVTGMEHAEDTTIIVGAQPAGIPDSVPGSKETVIEIVENPDGSKTKTTVTTSFAANGDKTIAKTIEEITAP